MTEKDLSERKPDKTNLKDNWASEGEAVLFKPEELDIYVNKLTLESYIFHSKTIDYDILDYLEYDPEDHSVEVVKKDGTRLDLGVKIQWLVRPYFTKAETINIVRTKDGDSVDGISIPLFHKKKK